jgi:hypothetical protein
MADSWDDEVKHIDPLKSIDEDSGAFTAISVDATPEQPAAFVTVTMYVPEIFTEIDAVVALVLHKYDVPPVAVKVVLCPAQIILAPLIDGAGNALTVNILDAKEEQPNPFVAVTVYVPAVLTEITEFVSPVLQR